MHKMDREKEKLIEELMHNATVADKILEQRLADTAAWFFANKDRISPIDVGTKCQFLEKTCWLLIEICALQAERIHQIEGRSTHLWLPAGINARGDVKRFG